MIKWTRVALGALLSGLTLALVGCGSGPQHPAGPPHGHEGVVKPAPMPKPNQPPEGQGTPHPKPRIQTLPAKLPDTFGQQRIGMANPASVYCHSLNGKTTFVHTPQGVVGICTLADGSQHEEWALYRRAHKAH